MIGRLGSGEQIYDLALGMNTQAATISRNRTNATIVIGSMGLPPCRILYD
jgi:hypothetical protein